MTVALKLKITYGAFAVGTGTEDTYRIKDERFGITRGRLDSSVDFSVIVVASSYATLETLSASLEEYRKRRKSLLIQVDGNTVQYYNETSNYSRNSESDYTLVRESEFNTGYEREYAVSIKIDLPPPETNGRTELGMTLTYNEARAKVITIRAHYDATSAGTAKANYEADSSYFTGVLAVWGGTYDLPRETIESPDIGVNTDLTVSLEYTELIFNQADGTLQDLDLIGFSVSVARDKNWPGDYSGDLPEVALGASGQVSKLIDIVISMSTFLDKTRTTDLTGKWEGTIRPYLLSYAKTLLGVTTIAVTSDNMTPDPVRNFISATLRISAAMNGVGQIISAQLNTRIQDGYGVIIVPVADGSLYGALRIQTKGKKVRTVTQTTIAVGPGGLLHIGNPQLAGHPGNNNEDGWQILDREYVEAPQTIGIIPNAGEFLDITSQTITRVEQYVTAVQPISTPVISGGRG